MTRAPHSSAVRRLLWNLRHNPLLRTSPQKIDPLSWFTGPGVPLVLGLVAVSQGLFTTILFWGSWSNPWLQLVALPVFFVSAILTSVLTQPLRPRFGAREVALVLAVSGVGLVMSTLGTIGGEVPVEQWWPVISFAVTLAGVAPHSSVLQNVSYAIPSLLLVVAVGAPVFIASETFWRPTAVISILCGPVLVAAVASSVFSYTIVVRTARLIASEAITAEAAEHRPGPHVESTIIARIAGQVAPFLRAIADAGEITEADRERATQLAHELRTDLVSAANRSWLDDFAAGTPLAVSDDSRRANQMNDAQRSALRGLLAAALADASAATRSPLIELHAQANGSTLVTLTMGGGTVDSRRLAVLAPYYLTLKTAVDDLSWGDGASPHVRFRIAAPR